MINPSSLLTDLKKWVTRLEDDLSERCKEFPEVDKKFRDAYDAAKDSGRTAFTYEQWRDQELTQVSVAWILACVFVRFLEDNELIDNPWISGPGDRRSHASEVRERYFQENPHDSDNNYLEHAFSEVAKLPGMGDLFDRRHNPLWQERISGDASRELISFWRKIDDATGELVHDFTDADWNTRFLGDLYQDLSESARKRFALLQTPDFVEEFILDRTLEPAIETFGFKEIRMIDPTCGSGHFLLGAFPRLLDYWRNSDDRLSNKEVAVNALKAIHGVDINPFAVAIARFRLLLAAWKYSEVKRLKAAPAFKVNLAVGDSLIHGARFREFEASPGRQATFDTDEIFRDETAHYFEVEDQAELHRILGQQYHAVVGNPPYITVKDKSLNLLYRQRFDSCHRKYSLSVPFMERIFDLALRGSPDGRLPGGFTGQITANSYMKREFGKKLIENIMPSWNITHVIDTSGAYIPGHGTPTVILFGRNARPTSNRIRTIMGIKGEPSTPDRPEDGKVWKAINDQIDRPNSEGTYVSSIDEDRNQFLKHPWSIGGGGASKLKQWLEESKECTLCQIIGDIGIFAISAADEIFTGSPILFKRNAIEEEIIKSLVEGDQVREWSITPSNDAIFPYLFEKLCELNNLPNFRKYAWPWRTELGNRATFGRSTYFDEGRPWWEWHQVSLSRLTPDYTICFGEITTHNNFYLVRGGSVFNRTSPVIKLNASAAESDYSRILGTMNSSTTCFWLKQVCFPKGGDHQGSEGARVRASLWDERYSFNSTQVKECPIPPQGTTRTVSALQSCSDRLANMAPDSLTQRNKVSSKKLTEAKETSLRMRSQMMCLQEELDWQCYRLYGLIQESDQLEWPEDQLENLPGIRLGERAFEILMARQMAEGKLETTWFERHKEAGSKPITEIPSHWPEAYKKLVERRIEFIESNKSINLIERPEYKRRWNTEPWDKRQQAALEQFLLTRLESYFFEADRMIESEDEDAKQRILDSVRKSRANFPGGTECKLVSTKQLSDAAANDPQWMEAAQIYTGNEAFDVPKLVKELVEKESVPYLPIQRYKDSGLRNRIQWERTWVLQRAEDTVEARIRTEHPDKSEEQLKLLIRDAQQKEVGNIPIPPKYKSSDFKKSSYWKLRGKLDVPKERWVIYPGTERAEDPSPVIAWAGWDQKQQLQALGACYYERQTVDGWEKDRLLPLLAGMKDLLPWVKQWHNEIDPEFNERLGDFYEGYVRDQCHELGITETDLGAARIGN